METEIWKDIEGYEGLYQVSNLGRIKSMANNKTRKEKILKENKNNYGYHIVGLSKKNVRNFKLVHRLVAMAFIENVNNYKEINHIDENKDNNSADNLEWTTHSMNIKHGSGMKRAHTSVIRNGKPKRVLCVETGVEYPSTMSASKATGVVQSNISQCCNGIFKKAGGFHWKYAE